MRSLSHLLLSICMIAAIGCSEDFTPVPYTYTKVFSGENNKTWKITLFEETLDGKVVDKFMPSCLTDDRYVFYANSDHSYQALSGSRKCFTDEPDATNDRWSFTNATATLIMVLPIFSDSAIPFIVRKADTDKMELEIFFDDTNTGSYRIHFDAIDEE